MTDASALIAADELGRDPRCVGAKLHRLEPVDGNLVGR
jgi:hypothetical protein